MINDSDRTKIAAEIKSLAERVAEAKFKERAQQILVKIKRETGADLSYILDPSSNTNASTPAK